MNQQAEFSDIRGDFCPVGQEGLLLMYRDHHTKTTLQQILDDHYRLETCQDVVIAPDALKQQEIGLILIEANFFNEVGYTLRQQLKAQRWSRGIPIIVVGDRDPQHVAAAFEAGAQDYLSQPLLAEEVMARIQARLSDFRQGQQLSQQNQLLLAEVRDRKQAEEAHQQAETKYRRIFENATEGIFQTSREGQYISVNPALAKIYGYTSPNDLMQGVTDVGKELYVQPQRRAELVVYLEQFNQIEGSESEVYRRDGSKIWISETIRKVYDE